MAEPAIPPAPRGTKAGGRRLWRSILSEYELDEHELAILREAVRTIDTLDDLDAIVRESERQAREEREAWERRQESGADRSAAWSSSSTGPGAKRRGKPPVGGMLIVAGGQLRVHPAAVEARQLRITLARLLSALRLPSGEEDARPQRRTGVRGTYKLRSVS